MPGRNNHAFEEFKAMVQPGIGLVLAVTRKSQRLLMTTVVLVSAL